MLKCANVPRDRSHQVRSERGTDPHSLAKADRPRGSPRLILPTTKAPLASGLLKPAQYRDPLARPAFQQSNVSSAVGRVGNQSSGGESGLPCAAGIAIKLLGFLAADGGFLPINANSKITVHRGRNSLFCGSPIAPCHECSGVQLMTAFRRLIGQRVEPPSGPFQNDYYGP